MVFYTLESYYNSSLVSSLSACSVEAEKLLPLHSWVVRSAAVVASTATSHWWDCNVFLSTTFMLYHSWLFTCTRWLYMITGLTSKTKKPCLTLFISNHLNCRAVMPKSPLIHRGWRFILLRPLKMEFLCFNLDESALILINIECVICWGRFCCRCHSLGLLWLLFPALKPEEAFRKAFIRWSSAGEKVILLQSWILWNTWNNQHL